MNLKWNGKKHPCRIQFPIETGDLSIHLWMFWHVSGPWNAAIETPAWQVFRTSNLGPGTSLADWSCGPKGSGAHGVLPHEYGSDRFRSIHSLQCLIRSCYASVFGRCWAQNPRGSMLYYHAKATSCIKCLSHFLTLSNRLAVFRSQRENDRVHRHRLAPGVATGIPAGGRDAAESIGTAPFCGKLSGGGRECCVAWQTWQMMRLFCQDFWWRFGGWWRQSKVGKIWENSSINHDTSINGCVPLPGFNWYLDDLMGDWMVGGLAVVIGSLSHWGLKICKSWRWLAAISLLNILHLGKTAWTGALAVHFSGHFDPRNAIWLPRHTQTPTTKWGHCS